MHAYAIVARRGHFHLPIFYILRNVQGVTNTDHAVRVAQAIVGPDVVIVSAELVVIK